MTSPLGNGLAIPKRKAKAMIWERITNPHDRMQRAMRKLADDKRAQFWGIIGLSMPMIAKADLAIPTMATDGKVIFYHPDYVMTLSETRCMAVIAHEITHPALRHFQRLANWPIDIANIAADYETNLDLHKAGFDLPDDCLLDYRFDGMSAEQIAHVVSKENEKAKREQEAGQLSQPDQGQGQGQPGQGQPGQGQPGQGQPGNNGLPHKEQSGRMLQPTNDDGTPMSGQEQAALAEQWAERTAQALGAARKAGLMAGGHIPSSLESFKKHLGASNLVDWRLPLRQFIDALGSTYQTFAKPSRRGMARGMVLPGQRVLRPSLIGWYVDVSSSMDETKNTQALVEAQAALDDGACDAIELVYVNTRIVGTDLYERGDKIVFRRATSGGTDFDTAMDYAHGQEYAALVFLTDGQCGGHWGIDPDCPVLWAITDTVEATAELDPPYGDKLCLYTAR